MKNEKKKRQLSFSFVSLFSLQSCFFIDPCFYKISLLLLLFKLMQKNIYICLCILVIMVGFFYKHRIIKQRKYKVFFFFFLKRGKN